MAEGLLNKASIILTPTGYKAGTLYNVAPVVEPYEDFDFARTSTATRINSSGLVSNVATGVPRISYDSNGQNGHILLEPTSTNLITYSEDFSDSSWAKTNCTINSNNSISPEGTQNADKLDFTTSNGEIVRTTSFVSGQEYTMSFYAKTESGTLDFYYGNMDYTMNSGTATTEWQRFKITQTLPSATRFPKIQTTEIGSLLLWGFQIEQLPYATSYIPTLTGSTETRATETATGAGSADLINSTEGVLYVEAKVNSETDFSVSTLSISDGTDNNRISILLYRSSDVIRSSMNYNGSTQFDFNLSEYSRNQYYKIAVLFQQNNCKIFINGSQIGSTDTSATMPSANTFNQLNLNLASGSYPFYGEVKALAVFNEALSDSELNNLTG